MKTPSKAPVKFMFYLVLLGCSNSMVTAQIQEPKIIPPSPGASALAKFVDVPVGVYTGIPNISIPLHSVDLEKTKLDIAISYHSLGNKVNDEASNVGLAWSLNAGGVITREIRGKPDEGGSRTTYNPDLFRMPSDMLQYFDDLIDRYGFVDAEPDIYTYNFSGYKGKFFFDYTGKIQLLEKSDVKIIKKTTVGAIFEIITPDGLIYGFGENNYCETVHPDRTAYFLTSIKDHFLNELARFEYEAERTIHFSLEGDYTKYIISSGYPVLIQSSLAYQKHLTATAIDTWRLKTITFQEGSVVFNYKSTNREDILYTNTAKAIESIVVNNFNRPLKKVMFSTSYFETPGSDAVAINVKHNYKRLRLDKLVISSPDNPLVNETYTFKYNQELLPPKRSFCQDLWGFYNGKTANGEYKNQALGHMIPNITNQTAAAEFWVRHELLNDILYKNRVNLTINLPGADRNSDNNYTQACILERINLPTQGYKKFEYELNAYYDYKNDRNVTGNGLRIKTQIFNDGSKDETWSYSYNQPDAASNSSGYLDSKPQFIYFDFNKESEVSWYSYLMVNSFTPTEVRTSGGGIVVYSDVEVKQTYISNNTTINNGRTLYSFYTSSDSELHDQENYLTFGLRGGNFPGDHPKFPDQRGVDKIDEFYEPSGHYLPSPVLLYLGEGVRGKPRSVKYFDSALGSDPLKEEHYTYSEFFNYDVTAAKVSNFDGMYFMRKYKIRPSLSRLDSKSVIENGVISSTQYTYPDAYAPNPHYLPISEHYYPDNKTVNYKYTYDFPQTTIANSLSAKNVYDPIFKEVWKNGKLIDLTYNEYGTNLRLSKIHTLSSKDPLTVSPVTYTAGGYTIDQSLVKPEILFEAYDLKGNILQHRKNNNLNTAYIWAYNQSYPIIKSENVDNVTLETAYRSALSAAGITDFAEISTPSLIEAQKTKLKLFNNALLGNASLSKAQTTIFTYIPLVGMTSQTDTNGTTTYYEYDDFGRLRLLKDQDGNILKRYEYNYKQ